MAPTEVLSVGAEPEGAMNQCLIADGRAALITYTHERDAADFLACWQDEGTCRGYNHIMPDDMNCITGWQVECFPFWATAVDLATGESIGVLRMSPEPEAPDLAIWVWPACRGKGWGTRIYRLALEYLAGQGYSTIYAGCFEYNTASLRMIERLGFVRDPAGDSEEISVFDGSRVRMLGFVKRSGE